MGKKSLLLSFFIIMGLQNLLAETLTIQVENADPGKGYNILVGISDKEEGYPDKSFTWKTVPVTDKTVTVVFTDLQKGIYAVSLYQDTNGNEKLDTVLGIPREKYGFSNNTMMPNYGKNQFELNKDTTITIKLR
ncbi:hypothetical protein AGMMS49940_00460 [Spirochaetia bacterium]|nr:hypothetical protein AGMMS49940_00460 [Spirochaetia bacterium]